MISRIYNYFYPEDPEPQIQRLELCRKHWSWNKTFKIPDQETNKIFKYFATNIPIDKIKSVKLEIGGQHIDEIQGDLFQTLYYFYEIPKTNANGNAIIPFYMSDIGIPYLNFHTCKIHVRYNAFTADDANEYFIEASFENVGYDYQDKENVSEQVSFMISKHEDNFYNNRFNFYCRRPVFGILIKDQGQLEKLTFTFESNNPYFLRVSTITGLSYGNGYTLFKFPEDLHDYPNYIVFTKEGLESLQNVDLEGEYTHHAIFDKGTINTLKSNRTFYTISLCPIRYNNGMIKKLID